jgi:U3 small nucleolar RNA-associated protein 20
LAAETIARDEDAINRRPIQVDTVARGCVAVLEQSTGQFAVELDEGLVTQTVKNLTFVTVVLMKAAPSDHDSLVALRRENESNRGREAREAEDADDDDERDEKGDASTKTHDDVNKPFKEKTLRPPVPWLFRRLSKVGAGGCGSARGGVLKWTSLLARSLGETGFTRNPSVAPALVLPNALCADENVSGIGDDIRELAAEALEVLRATMPGDLFSRAASETRVRINQRRDERRKRKALEAVTDPQRAARMKTSKNEKRSLARKRKIQEFRSGKGSGGSTKKRAREV